MQRVLIDLSLGIEYQAGSISLRSSPRLTDSVCHNQNPAWPAELSPTCAVCRRTKNFPPLKFRLYIDYNWDDAVETDSGLED